MNDLKNQVLQRVEKDLILIEAALLDNLTPYLDVVSEVARHIIFSGGKRLRPLLFLQSARLCRFSGDNAAKLSTVFEYLHTATLLHDDIVDDAVLRRGKTAAHSLWGDAAAVLVGDFLLARASAIATEADNFEVIRVLAEIIETMSQGELHQIVRKGRIDLTEAEYFEIIRGKTAILFEGACRIGAVVGSAPEPQIAALTRYGHDLGIAFQLTDDLIDYISESRIMGKNPGTDLREGKVTLPLIVTLQKAAPPDRKFIEKVIQKRDFSAADFRRLIDILQGCGAIAETLRKAAEHIASAKAHLALFEVCESREILEMIADYTLTRNA